MVSIGSTASRGMVEDHAEVAGLEVDGAAAVQQAAPSARRDGSGGSSSEASGQSSTCTYTRFPFRVVTPQGRGAIGPPRVP